MSIFWVNGKSGARNAAVVSVEDCLIRETIIPQIDVG